MTYGSITVLVSSAVGKNKFANRFLLGRGPNSRALSAQAVK